MADRRLCSINGCGKPSKQKGWCWGHYSRWRRHGNPVEGGTVRGEPARYINETVLTFTGDECLIWPFNRSSNGRGMAWIDGRMVLVHRHVCEAVHGDAPSVTHEAAHVCGRGDHGCVSPHHVRWKTKTQNEADKAVHGTRTVGQRNGWAVLSDDQVRQIRSLGRSMPQRLIAAQFGVSQSTVSEIQTRLRWSHVE